MVDLLINPTGQYLLGVLIQARRVYNLYFGHNKSADFFDYILDFERYVKFFPYDAK